MSNEQSNHSQHRASGIKYPVCLLVHDMSVPMNVGSLFRIADAFALEKLYLTGNSAVPPNAKIKKTARSTEKYVPYVYANNPLEIIGQLKEKGYTIISLEITSASTDIRNLAPANNDKLCLIVGSENKGVCPELLNVSDKTVHIPMLGQNSSMNVATACAIAAYEIVGKYIK